MAKNRIDVSIDPEVLIAFDQIVGKGSRSNKIEDLMRGLITNHSADLSKINHRILKLEVERLEEERVKVVSQLQAKQQLINEVEDTTRKREEAILEAQKREAEAAIRCVNCRQICRGQYHEFPKGKICDSCWKSSAHENLRDWMIAEVGDHKVALNPGSEGVVEVTE